MNAVRIIMLMLLAFILFCLLIEFRSKKNKYIFLASWPLLIAVNAVIISLVGFVIFNKIYPLTVLVPIYLVINAVSKQRGFKLLYTFLSVVLVTIISYIIAFMISYYIGDIMFWETFIRIIVFGIVIFIVAKFYRNTYLMMINTLEKGWIMLCAVPLFAYISIYPVVIKNIFQITNEFRLTILFYMISLIFNYFVNAKFFQIVIKENSRKTYAYYLATQIKAMQEQSKNFLKVEDKIKIYRHDMRHFLNELSVIVKEGDLDTALRLIGEQDKSLHAINITKYCIDPVINAIINYNFNSIIKNNIELDYDINLYENLPIDNIDLSTILANALENAKNACLNMPDKDKRFIVFKCKSTLGKLVIEITNAFNGEVELDNNGYPVSHKEGHGFGTRSIVELAKKHNAVLDFRSDGNIFKFSLLLQ